LVHVTSADVTVAVFTFTTLPLMEIVSAEPCSEVAFIPLLRLAASTVPLTTWYVRMAARSERANSCALVTFKAVNAAAKAASVGAKTVKGPVPLRVVVNFACVSAAAKIVKLLATAVSTMFFWAFTPERRSRAPTTTLIGPYIVAVRPG